MPKIWKLFKNFSLLQYLFDNYQIFYLNYFLTNMYMFATEMSGETLCKLFMLTDV